MSKMDQETLGEAMRVLDALRSYETRINQMLDQSKEGARLSPWDAERLQQMTVALKADIKAAAKRGKINDDRAPQTRLESAYYDPAMREASARFALRTNTKPSTSTWRSGLRVPLDEITYYIWQLERDCRESQ